MLLDEWHPTQLYMPLLVPCAWIWRALVPSRTGMILAFRCIDIAFSALTALALSRTLKSARAIGALVSALAFVWMCVPLRAGDYKHLCVAFCLWAFIHLRVARTAAGGRKAAVRGTLAGVAASCAVLCCPALAPFVLTGQAALSFRARRTGERAPHFGWFGIFLSAGVYLAALLAHVRPSQIGENLAYLFMDPEHQLTLADRAEMFVSCFVKNLTPVQVVWTAFLCGYVAYVARMRRTLPAVIPLAALLSSGLFVLWPVMRGSGFGLGFYAVLALGGLPCVLDACLRRRHIALPALYGCGLVLMVAWSLTSNLSTAPSHGAFVCMCASLLLFDGMVPAVAARRTRARMAG